MVKGRVASDFIQMAVGRGLSTCVGFMCFVLGFHPKECAYLLYSFPLRRRRIWTAPSEKGSEDIAHVNKRAETPSLIVQHHTPVPPVGQDFG